jgi:PhoPQ-activated pathogenicity-related protein
MKVLVGLRLLVILLISTAAAWAQDKSPSGAIPSQIFEYMAREEPSFAWSKISAKANEDVNTWRIDFTSQKWQGIEWKHSLTVIEPGNLEDRDHVIIFVAGGSVGDGPRDGDVAAGTLLARVAKMRVAVLQNVPNQPLMEGKKEDDLITESWLRYLDTGDATWPLLFPMVKSAVKAMDVVQAFSEAEFGSKPKSFFITGASKRGWTSWLTPVVDKRIKATAPLVIDVLNFRPQMNHQLDTWGAYSEQIEDYTRKGLIKKEPGTPREEALMSMMDPYTYRSRLALPKLIVIGSNDPYWVLDATSFYWNDLEGPKSALVIPNAGHNLDNKNGGKELALSTVAIHFRMAAKDQLLPALTYEQKGDVLHLKAEKAPKFMKGWTAFSSSKDFRESKWNPISVQQEGAAGQMTVKAPAAGHVAWFCECGYEAEGVAFSVCTLMQFK